MRRSKTSAVTVAPPADRRGSGDRGTAPRRGHERRSWMRTSPRAAQGHRTSAQTTPPSAAHRPRASGPRSAADRGPAPPSCRGRRRRRAPRETLDLTCAGRTLRLLTRRHAARRRLRPPPRLLLVSSISPGTPATSAADGLGADRCSRAIRSSRVNSSRSLFASSRRPPSGSARASVKCKLGALGSEFDADLQFTIAPSTSPVSSSAWPSAL